MYYRYTTTLSLRPSDLCIVVVPVTATWRSFGVIATPPRGRMATLRTSMSHQSLQRSQTQAMDAVESNDVSASAPAAVLGRGRAYRGEGGPASGGQPCVLRRLSIVFGGHGSPGINLIIITTAAHQPQ